MNVNEIFKNVISNVPCVHTRKPTTKELLILAIGLSIIFVAVARKFQNYWNTRKNTKPIPREPKNATPIPPQPNNAIPQQKQKQPDAPLPSLIVQEKIEEPARTPTPPPSLSTSTAEVIPESEKIFEIAAIDPDFTKNLSIEEQRKAHQNSKEYLEIALKSLNAEVDFVSPKSVICKDRNEVIIKKDLRPNIFSWKEVPEIQVNIQNDGKNPLQIVLYGIRSQYNLSMAENITRFTPAPHKAVETCVAGTSSSQETHAQLQFPNEQVEFINNASNLGFNTLCHVLDETTKTSIDNGYFAPLNDKSARLVLEQIKKNGQKMEFLCVGNTPIKGTSKVYMMLVPIPAFGEYTLKYAILDSMIKQELSFLCALYGFRAQFQQAIKLAESNYTKSVIFRPSAYQISCFGNDAESVAKGFYQAAKEHEQKLISLHIRVEFQVPKKLKSDPIREVVEKLFGY